MTPVNEFSIVKNPPFVTVVGLMMPQARGYQHYMEYRGIKEWNTNSIPDDPETLIESGGRICYASWNNPLGRKRADYISEALVGSGHGSVLEHGILSVIVADLPRSIQLELVRHRIGLSPSFESQRFVDKNIRFVMPPLIRGDPLAEEVFELSCRQAFDHYQTLIGLAEDRIKREEWFGEDRTLRRKRARESARSVLGNNVGSDGQLTLNARTLRHILTMRSDEHAEASIREFSWELLRVTEGFFPGVFADVIIENVDFGPPSISFANRKI